MHTKIIRNKNHRHSVASIIKKYEEPKWVAKARRVLEDSDSSDSESIGSQESLRSIEQEDPTESDNDFIDDSELPNYPAEFQRHLEAAYASFREAETQLNEGKRHLLKIDLSKIK